MSGIQRVTERAGPAPPEKVAPSQRRYDPATLERWNIINRVVAPERLEETALTLARELANGPTIAHASTKAIVSHAVSYGVEATDKAMKDLQREFWKSNDLKVGLASLQEH